MMLQWNHLRINFQVLRNHSSSEKHDFTWVWCFFSYSWAFFLHFNCNCFQMMTWEVSCNENWRQTVELTSSRGWKVARFHSLGKSACWSGDKIAHRLQVRACLMSHPTVSHRFGYRRVDGDDRGIEYQCMNHSNVSSAKNLQRRRVIELL